MKKINNHTRTEISRFIPSTGICEYHAIIHITRPELTFDQQLSALLDAYDYLLKHEANGAKAVFKRFFLSDVVYIVLAVSKGISNVTPEGIV